MSRSDPRSVLSQIHLLAGGPAPEECPDRELLERFRWRRDETAFAKLVQRYGPLVWGVCRRILGDPHDAEDAFQAAFLILARKAQSIRRAKSLGAWLHRVARQLALRARASRDRRRTVENGSHGGGGTQTRAAGRSELSEELSLREALAILDDEVDGLPEKFRGPIVLCYLQGKTNVEAARELGCPAGTLKSRLARARDLLGERLKRRGVELCAGAAAVLLATSNGGAAGLPAALTMAAVVGAVAFASPGEADATANSVQLAQEIMRAMTMSRIKVWAVGILALLLVAAGTGVLARQAVQGGVPPAAPPQFVKANEATDQPKVNKDLHGDPLPPAAVVRLGTVRWRHGMRANVVAFAAGGKEVVTAGPDGQVRVWDVGTGRELRHAGAAVDPNAHFLRPAAVSADGQRAATSGNGCVHVWDLATGKELRRVKVENMDNLIATALTPDGKGLLISNLDAEVVLWDVATGKEGRRFEVKSVGDGPAPAVGGLVFSPDGKFLAAPFFEGLPLDGPNLGICLWDVATGKEVRRMGERTKGANDFPPNVPYPAFSPDGKVIARVALDGTLRLHGSGDGKEQRSLGKPDNGLPISGVLFSPDGKSLAVLRSDQTIQLFDTNNGKELLTLDEGQARTAKDSSGIPMYSPDAPPLAFAPDGKTLAVLSGVGWGQNGVRLWNLTTGKPLPAPAGHTGAVLDVALASDGKSIVTCGTDRTLRRWEAATGKELHCGPLPGDEGLVGLSATGRLLAYAADEKPIALWDVAAGKDKAKVELPRDGGGFGVVYLARFSADEKVLATADLAGAVRLWDPNTGKEVRTLTVKDGDDGPDGTLLRAVEFSPDGKTLLTVRAYETDSAPGQGGKLFAPLASGEPKSILCLWDTVAGKALRRWEVSGTVASAAFTPDGRALATAAGDCVTLWETATGKERCRSKGAASFVVCSPDGCLLAASDGATIRLLDARTCQELGRLKGHEADVQVLVFTQDGKSLVSGSADSTALVWDTVKLAPVAKIDEQSAERLEKLWSDLGDDDAGKAFRAVAVLRAAPKGTVALFAKRLKPVSTPDAQQLNRLINELDSESFQVRAKAAAELAKFGELARSALEQTLKEKPSVEQRRSIKDLLERLTLGKALTTEELRRWRALEVLESLRTPEAKQMLEELAKGAPGASLTRDADAALRRLRK